MNRDELIVEADMAIRDVNVAIYQLHRFAAAHPEFLQNDLGLLWDAQVQLTRTLQRIPQKDAA